MHFCQTQLTFIKLQTANTATMKRYFISALSLSLHQSCVHVRRHRIILFSLPTWNNFILYKIQIILRSNFECSAHCTRASTRNVFKIFIDGDFVYALTLFNVKINDKRTNLAVVDVQMRCTQMIRSAFGNLFPSSRNI